MDAMYGTKDGGIPMTPEESCGVSTPEDFTDWLIKYHQLPERSRRTVELNMKTQFKAERAVGYLQGSGHRTEVHIHFSLFGKRYNENKVQPLRKDDPKG